MLFTLTATAFAAETTNGIATIITDNADIRIAETHDTENRYVSTLDKHNNTITTERFSLSGTLEATTMVDLNCQTIYDSQTNLTISTQSVIASKSTESVYAYEYTNDNPKEWKLVRAKYSGESNDAGYYFKTKQTTTNKNDLTSFRQTVDSLASKESELLGQVGASSFFGGFSTGFLIGAGPAGFGIALAGYIAAAGFGITAQQTSNKIGELQSDALDFYTDVKNESSIYF